jgi:hypothetical protein
LTAACPAAILGSTKEEETMRNAVLVFALVLAGIAAAQDNAAWQQKFNFSLLLNEGLYSTNWQGDEKTAGSVTASIDHAAQKQLAPVLKFEHAIGLAFGQQVTDEGDDGWQWAKSEDKIRLDEVLRLTLGIWVDPFVSAALKSQFIDGRDTARQRWLNPLEFLEAAGVGRTFFESDARALKSQLGAAARQLLDAADTLTVSDAGVTWSTDFRTRLGTPDAGYSTKLVLYKPLVALGGSRDIGTWPQLDWQHELNAKIGKFITAKAYVQLLYDEVVNDRLRFKQTLGLGLSYAWSRGM